MPTNDRNVYSSFIYNIQTLKTAHRRMAAQTGIFTMEYHLTIQRNKLLTQTVTWMNLKHDLQ